MLLLSIPAMGQEKIGEQIKQDLIQQTTFGGYVTGKASVNDQKLSGSNKSHTNMELRYARLYADGKVLDFKYKLQMEVTGVGGTDKEKGPRVIDAWAEWQRYKWLYVRFGQFKRAFTFENPMSPWDIGFGSYSQLTDKLAGMNDRIGEHASGGRDIGLQLQGDLLPVGKERHNLLHYQVAVYNGQGINHGDENNHKDLIGGIYLSPVKHLAIGAFGWNGNYTKNGVTADRKRWTAGLKYEADWTVRAEYALSKGHKISDYDAETSTFTGNDKADAWYVCVGAPVGKKCKVYAKWDVYRDDKQWSSQKSIYALAANYYFYKNLKLQANYNYVFNKNTTGDRRYNTFDLQLYWRF